MSVRGDAAMYEQLQGDDVSEAAQRCCPPRTCALAVAFLLVATCVCVFFLGSVLEIGVDVSNTVHGDPSYIVDAITLTGGALVGVGLLLVIVTAAACRSASRRGVQHGQPSSCVDRWLPEHFNLSARKLVADVTAAGRGRHVRVSLDGSVNQNVEPPVLPAESCFFTWKVCFVLVGAIAWLVANILLEVDEEQWDGIHAPWQKGGWVVFVLVMTALAAGVNWIHIRQSTVLDYTCRCITNRMVQSAPTACHIHHIDVNPVGVQPEEEQPVAGGVHAAHVAVNIGDDADDADVNADHPRAPSEDQVIDWVERYTTLVKQHNTTWGYVAMGCSLVQIVAILGLGPATYLNFAHDQVSSSRINLLAMFSHILLVVPMWMGSAAVTSAGVAALERTATEGRPGIGWLILRLQAVDWQAKIGGVPVTYTGVMYAVYATMILLLALVRFIK